MNGLPVGRQFEQVSMYVAQEEMFVPTLSCWETLHIHAALRNRSRESAPDLQKRMQDVLSVMGLSRVRDTQVGGVLAGGIMVRGLSGGEKRRLSIACALIAQPSLLFLDEPTTGLDSFAALNIMEHMSCLAAMGHTIVASVHQPRTAIWEMFHKVLLLSEGHQLYFGPPQEAISWFSDCLGYTFWPDQRGAEADWLMDLVSVGFSKPQALRGASMASQEDVTSTEADVPHQLQISAVAGKITAGTCLERSGTRHAVSWWTQYWWLLKRSLVAQLRNPTDVTSRLLLSCWIGLLAGLVFFNLDSGPAAAFQRMGVLYFTMLLFELLPFCYMSFYVWDRTFFLSDRASGLYSTSAYYAAHMTASLPFIIVNTLCGALAAYGFAGLRYSPAAILLYSVILVLQSLIAIQVMVFCVYVSANQDIAYVLATGYVGLSILLSGFFVRPSQLKIAPLLWLSYISYPRWCFAGLAQNEEGGRLYWSPGCPSSPTPERPVAHR
ncbi:g432 [Coccomyxa viridis]|uniref:G432 protein n=1 Tax=Coccomyxa viridis TaxID=1274662 RepID=A0ABP1FJQ7_9CHLO